VVKGSALDPIVWVVMAVGFFFVTMISLYVGGQVNSGMKSGLETAGMDPTLSEKVFGKVSDANIAMSKTIMAVIILSMVAGLTFSFLIAIHPIFIFVSLLISMFAIVAGVVGHDIVAQTILAVPELATLIPGTLLFWGNILPIIAVYICLNLLAMYFAYQRGAGLS
jgi:hypothetical protein